LEVYIELGLVADAKDDAGLLVELETRLFDCQDVFSGGKAQKVVFAVGVGRGFESGGGGLFGHGHFGFRNSEAGGVVDAAEKLGFSGLGIAGTGSGDEQAE
jgi:hypothetical protein